LKSIGWSRTFTHGMMNRLVHLIYCSAAATPFSRDALAKLLSRARAYNEQNRITGLLLHAEGTFFQVLEGEEDVVERLFATIARDSRHERITVIVREPIALRDFSDWSMGFAEVSGKDLDHLAGYSDFFTRGESLARLEPSRAKKLLEAFRQGRWREGVTHSVPKPGPDVVPRAAAWPAFTFAFQPIVHAPSGTVFSHEALIRGLAGEPAGQVLGSVPAGREHRFNEQCCVAAIELAARLGLAARLNLNLRASTLEVVPSVIASILAAAARCHVGPERVVLEILESDFIRDASRMAATLREHLASGLSFAIDDFGAGYAGLTVLAEFQPAYVKLDRQLVRGIPGNGPRQAIVRGVIRTCGDLGIELVAEGVEEEAEYRWLEREGIELFQGYWFAAPAFEQLPVWRVERKQEQR